MLREEISRIVQQQMRDPRVGLATVTQVDVSPDLKQARVYVSVYGGEDQVRRTLEALESAKRYIRGELGHEVRLRYVPELTFVYDDSLARGSRVLELMDKIKRGESGEPGESGESGEDKG